MTIAGLATAFEQWQEGHIGPQEALRSLCMELGEVESDYEKLTQEREVLRNWIGQVVAAMDGKAAVPGFGELRITDPVKVESYDRKKLDALLMQLIQDGYAPIAEQISQCRTASMRVGSLRINREKL